MLKTESIFKLSEDQENIINVYEKGLASVLATPGSGKTTIITHLIKKLINEKNVHPKNILVLTLTESAAKEFNIRTKSLMKNMRSYPDFFTIHSFCNKTLSRHHPNYRDWTVLPDTKRNEKLEQILAERGFKTDSYEDGEINYLELFRDSIIPIFRKDKSKFDLVKKLTHLDLRELRIIAGNVDNEQIKCFYHIPDVIDEYEKFLQTEKFIDFDMMINETYNLFLENPNVVKTLRQQYKYILEDEAQDSNEIQNKILSLLAGEDGNYIRVGDPNQSIFTTFTGADYKNLINFYNNNTKLEIKQSNRSNQPIIDISNYLVDCHTESFPSHHVKIMQGSNNPRDGYVKIEEFIDIEDEIASICKYTDKFIKSDKNNNIAILTRTNNQAIEIYQRMIQQGFDTVLHGNKDEDFFNNNVVVKITALIAYIIYPYQYQRLEKILLLFGVKEEIIPDWFFDPEQSYFYLKSIANESFLHFGDEEVEEQIFALCKNIVRISDSVYSSVSEILELINNLFIDDIKEKSIARLLYQMWDRSKPGMKNIHDFLYWLAKHSKSKIKQELITEEEEDYSSPGVVHILTVHKAKGLQWDAVFVPNFSQWDYKDETWRGWNEKKDIKSVIISLIENIPRSIIRKQFAIEEIHESRRVGYVALTRAKKYLILTCSKNGLGGKTNKNSKIFNQLKEFQNKNESN